MATTQEKTVTKIKLLLRDRADNNILLDDVQFSPEEVESALELAADEYNILPPITNLTWDKLPPILAVLGAARFLAFSEAFLQLRNQVSLQNDHDEAMGVDDKFNSYMQLQNGLRAEWKELSRKYKNAQNADTFYGTLSSDYAFIGRYW